MINLRCLNTETNHTFEVTKFPDGTSQVWKISPEPRKESRFDVTWQFENESEFCHVLQLGHLLKASCIVEPALYMPFLPYGRQDKSVNNSATFAKHTIMNALGEYFRLLTFDNHSNEEFGTYGISSLSPKKFHESVFNHDVVCFPDLGANTRYRDNFSEYKKATCQKIRDQATGEITGLGLATPVGMIPGKRVLIVDDICDGGRTFIECARVLREFGAKRIDLAVSHGIFSKGKEIIHAAGIANIFTTNSLPQNADQFNVLF